MSERGAVDFSSPGESFSKLHNPEDREPALTGASLLLVDDKPELLNSMHQLITIHGYQADTALGGKEALELLADKHYDVVLLDL
ncbi:MAG: response regulator, partial [Gammaproteobacteria bacterium]|nr:response regulator [Gammaproteobacteria bacterium]